MAKYTTDYIKEKANYELIKIASILFVSVGVSTITELRGLMTDSDFTFDNINTIQNEVVEVKISLVIFGFVFLINTLIFIITYVFVTNMLLKKLNGK